MRRPSLSVLSLHNLTVTVEYAILVLLAREVMLAAQAPAYWFALLLALPIAVAAISMRWLDTLSGPTWGTNVVRSSLVFVSLYGLVALFNEPWAWLFANSLLPVGQVMISGQYRLILSNHHDDPRFIQHANALTRTMSGFGRLASFGAIVLFPLIWQNHLAGLALLVVMRLISQVTFHLFSRHEPPPARLRSASTPFGLPRLAWTPDVLAGMLGFVFAGVFGATEVVFFAHYAGAENYGYARALQYLAMALSALVIFSRPVADFMGGGRGVAAAAVVGSVGFLGAGAMALAGGGWILLAAILALVSGCISVYMTGADIMLGLLRGESRQQTVASLLFYRYVANIAGALVGPVLIYALGPVGGLIVAGGLTAGLGLVLFSRL